MTRIRAAVCHAFNTPLQIEEIDLRAPETDEVEVTLAAVAICQSDISYTEGAWGGPLPAVYGHEAAGTVSAVGPGVTTYAVGDKVLVTMLRSCGACVTCATGHPASCTTPVMPEPPLHMADGGALDQGLVTGAFAEKVVVHRSQLAPLAADMPLDSACLLACGVITGIGAAVNAAAIRPGASVVVIGAGGVGLNAIQGARIAGAARIIAVDMVADKLDAAREFGATDTILASEPKPWSTVRRITGGRGADAVLVTVGAIPAYDSATRYLAPGGQVIMVGMPHSGDRASYEPVVLARTGQGMTGSFMGDTVLVRDIPWMVDMYQQGRLKLDELISGRWRLDQINEAIADTKTGAARRNVIIF